MLSIGGMILQKWPFFAIFRDWGGWFSKFDVPARLPEFLPTTVKCNEAMNKKKRHHFDDQISHLKCCEEQKNGHHFPVSCPKYSEDQKKGHPVRWCGAWKYWGGCSQSTWGDTHVDYFWPRVKGALMSTIFGLDMADMIFLCNARPAGWNRCLVIIFEWPKVQVCLCSNGVF